jgi:hypothetical protein
MNDVQDSVFQQVNDNYDIARWEQRDTIVWIQLEDGDEGEILPTGELKWLNPA